MTTYQTIVVVHPGAIGDAVMGTPVAHTLRKNFPQAKILYLTHASLFPLLELSGTIDAFIGWDRQTSVFTLAQQVKEHKPDLAVDLVGSLRTRMVCWLSAGKTLTLRKRKDGCNLIHVVDNYLETLSPLQLQARMPVFPTLNAPAQLIDELIQVEDLGKTAPLIALVPGVGKLRPNRAWPADCWVALGKVLLSSLGGKLLLVGGPDDQQVCCEVKQRIGAHCHNLAGNLTLPETAALLSRVQFVVTADTGPAHISAAVGRPVICLMGPTNPLRTGPYDMSDKGLSVGDRCRCQNAKRCVVASSGGAGDCMMQITVDQVMQKIEQVLSQMATTTGSAQIQ